jgi:glycosyltransferase involved in cell wall biosynthesis
MRIAFLDRIDWDYRVDTPYRKPLGGSQSAMCYLAEAMGAAGLQVLFVTQTEEPVRIGNVDCLSARTAGWGCFATSDAIIVLNDADPTVPRAIRSSIGSRAPLILWTQHDVDQVAVASLADEGARRAWDAIVFVSEWQKARYQKVFGLQDVSTAVIRNGVAPAFRDLFSDDGDVLRRKATPPILAYTSTPFRGLDVLLDSFPMVRAAVTGATLQVYSSMAVYQVTAAEDHFAGLYERCRRTEGTAYIGSIPQPELARAMVGVAVFAYPSTFAETSCIAALEAMAAGCLPIVGDLGALRETVGEFGEVVDVPGSPADYAAAFAATVIRVLRGVCGDSGSFRERLRRQVSYVNTSAIWPVRASDWLGWLKATFGPRLS